MAKCKWNLGLRTIWLRCKVKLNGFGRMLRYKRLKSSRKRRDRKIVLPYIHCKNCGSELQGMYCHRCGQYALDVNQTFGQYIKQFFENTYQYDGRMMATFRAFFASPGKLTNEFMLGKVNSYMQPLKLYMFMSIIFFSFVLLIVDTSKPKEMSKTQNPIEYRYVVNDSIVRLLRDSLMIDMYKSRAEMELVTNQLNDDLVSRVAGFSKDSLKYVTDRDEVDEHIDNQKNEIFKERLMGVLQSNVPIVMMFMIPLYALIIRFQYRKKNKKYLNCFVFALHNSTMLLIFMSVAMLLKRMDMLNMWSGLFFYTLLLIYMVVSARNVFGVSWFRSSIKTLLGFHLYMFICALLLSIYIIVKIVLMVEEAKIDITM